MLAPLDIPTDIRSTQLSVERATADRICQTSPNPQFPFMDVVMVERTFLTSVPVCVARISACLCTRVHTLYCCFGLSLSNNWRRKLRSPWSQRSRWPRLRWSTSTAASSRSSTTRIGSVLWENNHTIPTHTHTHTHTPQHSHSSSSTVHECTKIPRLADTFFSLCLRQVTSSLFSNVFLLFIQWHTWISSGLWKPCTVTSPFEVIQCNK